MSERWVYGAVTGAFVGWWLRSVFLWAMSRIFSELYESGHWGPAPKPRLVCPDCIVGEPHVCPIWPTKGTPEHE